MIYTKRLTLYPLTLEDYQNLLEGKLPSIIQNTSHFSKENEWFKQMNVQHINEVFNLLSLGCDKRRLIWLILHRETLEILGDLGFSGIVDEGALSLDYRIEPNFRHNGYATEAIKALVFYQFLMDNTQVLDKINAVVDVNNHQSLACIEAAGFCKTDTNHKHLIGYTYRKQDFLKTLKEMSPRFEVLTSACLLGLPTRYDGDEVVYEPNVYAKYAGELHFLPICPEQYGGLSTPRNPVEYVTEEKKYLNDIGIDCTEAFKKGAKILLRYALQHDIKIFILKQNSPSCGSIQIYDGTFSGVKVNGKGCAVKEIISNNSKYIILDENDNGYICL